jgi:hypothetical protein
MTCWYRELAESETAGYDPLCVERSAPINDDEATAIEALCQAATPGPLVLDDATDGDGAPVVVLPDGRTVVSRTATVQSLVDPAVIGANAELICKARYYLLRLLRDRQRWQSERQALQARIAELEAQPAATAAPARKRRAAPKQPR